DAIALAQLGEDARFRGVDAGAGSLKPARPGLAEETVDVVMEPAECLVRLDPRCRLLRPAGNRRGPGMSAHFILGPCPRRKIVFRQRFRFAGIVTKDTITFYTFFERHPMLVRFDVSRYARLLAAGLIAAALVG